jgi:hypothetical protein
MTPIRLYSPSLFNWRVVLATALIGLMPVLAFGQQFRLLEKPVGRPDGSQGRDVCDAYLENLNETSRRAESIECSRPISPRLQDFGKPEWKPLNPLEHASLVRIFDEAWPSKRPTGDTDEKWTARFEDLVAKQQILLSLLRIDLDGDGMQENLIRYETTGQCKSDSPTWVKFGSRIFLVNDALSDLAGASRNGVFLVPGVRHDVFTYRGKPYFDFFSRARGPTSLQLVVQAMDTRSRPVRVCVFAYNPETKR